MKKSNAPQTVIVPTITQNQQNSTFAGNKDNLSYNIFNGLRNASFALTTLSAINAVVTLNNPFGATATLFTATVIATAVYNNYKSSDKPELKDNLKISIASTDKILDVESYYKIAKKKQESISDNISKNYKYYVTDTYDSVTSWFKPKPVKSNNAPVKDKTQDLLDKIKNLEKILVMSEAKNKSLEAENNSLKTANKTAPIKPRVAQKSVNDIDSSDSDSDNNNYDASKFLNSLLQPSSNRKKYI